MKLSAITLLFSTVLVPFVAVSATQYKCDSIASFHSEDDEKNPHVPSKDTLTLMADEMLQTFATAYQGNSDMNMVSDRFAKFSMQRESDDGDANTDGSDDTDSVTLLDSVLGNIGNLRKRRKWEYKRYSNRFSSYVGIVCRWCREDDDYTLASTGYDTIEEVLTNSQEHATWEQSFCEILSSANGFISPSGCKIQLKNCVPETPEEVASNNVSAADNYIVSDSRAVLSDDDKNGIVFTLESMDTAVVDHNLSTSE